MADGHVLRLLVLRDHPLIGTVEIDAFHFGAKPRRFVIPHGAGAPPCHWSRFRGLAQVLKKPQLRDHLLKNIFSTPASITSRASIR